MSSSQRQANRTQQTLAVAVTTAVTTTTTIIITIIIIDITIVIAHILHKGGVPGSRSVSLCFSERAKVN